MDEQSVLAEYTRLRAIRKAAHEGALCHTPPWAIAEAARRLGLMIGDIMICEGDGEEGLVLDLAIYDRKPGRSRAIDRYARATARRPGSDEALMAEAMRNARFSIWQVARRHEVAGLVVTDAVDKTEWWLMDVNMSKSLDPGFVFAGRLFRPAAFAMNCISIVPVDRDVFDDALSSIARSRSAKPAEVINDPRFVAAIYRAAVAAGLMATVEHRAPALAA